MYQSSFAVNLKNLGKEILGTVIGIAAQIGVIMCS
jgi:hypothetical protein